jgi:Immunity protein Imm1
VKLTVNTWDGPIVHSDENEAPTPDDIRAAVARLDGAACTEVSLTQDEPFAYFTAAGGPDLYLVTGETADEEILQLTTPDAGDDTIPLVCGGQLADFARHDLVDREAATRVLTRFLNSGDHDASLAWDVQ